MSRQWSLICLLMVVALVISSCGRTPEAGEGADASSEGTSLATTEQDTRPLPELVREAILLHAAADWTDVHASADKDVEWAEHWLTAFGYLVCRSTNDLAIIYQQSEVRAPAKSETIRWFQDESAALAWFREDPEVRRRIPVIYVSVLGGSAANARVYIRSGYLSVDQQGEVALRHVTEHTFAFNLTFGGKDRKRPILVLDAVGAA